MTKLTINLLDNGPSTEISMENFALTQNGITNWLQSKNIITEREIIISYEDILPWTRFGGETYGSSFKFSTKKQTKQIFVKAIVTTFPEKNLMNWVKRRNILSRSGIPVSNWYYYGEAIIFEDYYPLIAKDVNFHKILSIGHKLDQLSFSTLKFSDDIRADKNGNPFFVDFGFDLGDQSDKANLTAKNYLLFKFPDKINEITNFYM